jgi:ElaB/YqjD/DUF883 family membrane-anchored ribosome-binding protein
MKKSSGQDEIQGEGDYKSARRFNRASEQFVESHDFEALGRESAPHSPQEETELARAEAAGRSRAQGTRSAASEDLTLHSGDGVTKLITDVEDLIRKVAHLTDADVVNMRQKVENTLASTRTALEASAARARAGSRQAAGVAEGYVHQRPWTALATAAAVGALLGALSVRR